MGVDVVTRAEVVPRRRAGVLNHRAAVLVLTAVTGVVYAAFSIRLFDSDVAGWDLAIFHQTVLHYAELRAPTIPMRGPGYLALGDHFSPVLVLLVPLYWLWADPRALLLAQAALVVASVPVVARFTRRRTGARTALLVAAAYALGWPLQEMVGFDFHEVAFAVPLLALAVDALDRRSARALLGWSLALLTVREDMGLVVAGLGLLQVWSERGDLRCARPGMVLVGVGTTCLVVVTSVVIPHFAPDGAWHYWTYDQLGPDAPSALRFAVTHPLRVLAVLVTPQTKAATLAALLVTTFPALRSPLVLLALPLLAARFLSSRDVVWGMAFHYNAVVWPLLFLAAVDGCSRFGPRTGERLLRSTAGLGLVLPTLGALVASPFVVFNLADPVGRTIGPAPAAELRAVRPLVPASTCVQAETHLAPHLVATNLVTLPDDVRRPTDFVLLDTAMSASSVAPSGRDYLAEARSAGFVQVARDGRVVLLRSPDYSGRSSQCRP